MCCYSPVLFLVSFFPLSKHSLCVVGLASSHLAFKDEGGLTGVDFNVGKSDRSGIKVTGKRKRVILLWFLFSYSFFLSRISYTLNIWRFFILTKQSRYEIYLLFWPLEMCIWMNLFVILFGLYSCFSFVLLFFFFLYVVCFCVWFYVTLLQNAQHFESNTALCKVNTKDSSYIVRWCFSCKWF